MKFGHGLVDQVFGNLFEALRGGVEKASGSDIIDLSRYASGIVMNESFSLGFEDFIGAPGLGDAVVDIGAGLLL